MTNRPSDVMDGMSAAKHDIKTISTGLLAQIPTMRALADAERLAVVYRPLTWAMVGGVAAALIAGWARPAPWLLAVLLVAVLSAVWFFAVGRFRRASAWGLLEAPEPSTAGDG